MAGLIFWDVDTQEDFMRADGKLYVPDADAIIDKLQRLTDAAHVHGVRIVASSDDHTDADPEISADPDFRSTYPPHCMRGTPGQRKIPETALIDPMIIEPHAIEPSRLARRVREHQGDVLLLKHSVDVFENPNTAIVTDVLDPEAVVLYGVALDVCNRHAIEGLLRHRPSATLYLVTDAVKAIDADRGRELTASWTSRGVRPITTDEAVALAASLAVGETAAP